MYVIVSENTNGNEYFKAETFNDALEKASELSANADTKVIRENDNTVLWTSQDSEILKSYCSYDAENWSALLQGFHEYSDTPSIYIDIDGTAGYFYADGRGFSYPEEVLDPRNHYFRDIEPHEFIISLAEELNKRGYDVCIISAADKNTIRDKFEWLKINMPFIKEDNICFCPLGANKCNFVKGNSSKSVLIDDYNVNLDDWDGIPIKAVNSINSKSDKYPSIEGYAAEINPKIWNATMRDALQTIEQTIKGERNKDHEQSRTVY